MNSGVMRGGPRGGLRIGMRGLRGLRGRLRVMLPPNTENDYDERSE